MTAHLPLLAALDVAGSSSDQELPATQDVTSGPSQGEGDGPGVATTPARGTAEDTAAPAPGVGVVPASAPHLRIIGLDLSLTGIGMSDGRTTWLIASKGKAADGLPERQARLRRLRAEVVSHCESADLVVLEGPTYASTTGHAHDRGGLWWLVVMALHHRGIPIAEVSPPTLKKYATGKGTGDKGAMVDAAARRLPDVITRGDNNCADALWLHAMGLDYVTSVHVVPESHRVTLDVVRWPAVAAAS